ncbi:TPA: hypothetical protein IQC34_002895, partial [Listeria monocytogenes]|nr:hypothetical protein [Listeria monocytogenes]
MRLEIGQLKNLVLTPKKISSVFGDINLAKLVVSELSKTSVEDIVTQKELHTIKILLGNNKNITSL